MREETITSWGRLYTYEDNQFIAQVACIIHVSYPGELSEGGWWGVLRLVKIGKPFLVSELENAKGRLELNDGRWGEVVFTGVMPDPEGSGGRAFFKGLGLLGQV